MNHKNTIWRSFLRSRIIRSITTACLGSSLLTMTGFSTRAQAQSAGLICDIVEDGGYVPGRVIPSALPTSFRMTVQQSTATRPQTLRFAGPGELRLRLLRLAALPRFGITIEADATDATGRKSRCRSDLPDLGLMKRVRLASGAAGPVQWVIRVYDQFGSGVVEDPPYTIDLELSAPGAPLDARTILLEPQELPWSILVWDPGQGPRPACWQAVAATHPGYKLVEVGRIALRDLPSDGTRLVYAVAAERRLFARVEGQSHAVDGRFFAEGLTSPFCQTAAIPTDRYAVAEQPWQHLTSTWRVEVAGKPASTGSLVLYREAAPDDVAAKSAPDPVSILECVSFDAVDRRRSHPAPPQPSDFQSAISVSVRFISEPAVVAKPAHGELTDATLQAIGLWRNLCTSCARNQLIVVSIDGQVFLPMGLLPADAYGPTGTATAEMRDRSMRQGLATGRINDRNPRLSYQPITLSDRARAIACTPAAPGEQRFVDFAQSPVCRPTDVADEKEMKVDLVFIDRATGCGDAIACWNGNGIIQFDAANYRYYLKDPANILFGKGPIAVDLQRVLAHEAGHWIGLDHVAGPFGLMSEYYDQTRCVDDVAMARLNAIVTGAAPPPMRPTGQSLKYRRLQP